MSEYVAGNLLGRLVISYAIVWAGMLLTSRRDWREAFNRTHRWFGAASVAAVFGIGLAVAMA